MTAQLRTARTGPAGAKSALVGLALAGMLAAAGGCGAVSSAHNLVDNAAMLSSMAKKVTVADKSEFQATYEITGNGSVTVVQKPPQSALVTPTRRVLTTAAYIYVCDVGAGRRAECRRTPVADSTIDPSTALGVSGFVSGELALGVLSAAMLVPKAHVAKSTATIAGQSTTCVTVSGLDQVVQGASPDDSLSNFVVCITDSGILAKFAGNLTSGKKGDVVMTRYSATVDPNLLKPPKGAKITS